MSVLTEAKSMNIPIFHELNARSRNGLNDQHSNENRKTASKPAMHWRPTFHLTAPHGWLNDPCGIGYDPATKLYHLSFQWNPHGNDWGNVSWGHSVSSDLVSWKTSLRPCLTPSAQYDKCGVFTGCLRPTGIHGDAGMLTYIYTSVGHLPIHYTLPYVSGSESLSLAVSQDGGNTWKRADCNPILPGPPPNVNVTSWRDPYVTAWPAMRNQTNTPSSDLYGFISGGIRSESPTMFVYTVNPKDLREWRYIGPLVDVGLNLRPSRWSGDFGANWEVATLTTLTDNEGQTRDFAIMGTEGCIETNPQSERAPRGQLWMSVKLRSERENNNASDALADYAFAGIFDHGCFYAANSFFDPVTARHIVYGWIMEEDLPDTLRHDQGWSGLISLPRVVSLTTLHHVKRARRSELQSITSIETEESTGTGTGTYTIRTLGIQPDPRIDQLRTHARRSQLNDLELNPEGFVLPLTTSKWELDVEVAVGKQCTNVGMEINHGGPNSSSHNTVLSWIPSTETFMINRPQKEKEAYGINHSPEAAPHTLFTLSDPETGKEKEETLRVRAFFDMSVLEVFVNERTVISTRVYSSHNHCAALRFFAESDGGDGAVLLHAVVWDGLGVMHNN